MLIIGIIMIILAIIVVAFLVWLQLVKRERMKAAQILSPNGTNYGEYVEVGGIKQYLYHRSEDVEQPVLLLLHGGPGSPMLPLAQDFQIPWEKHVTVVQWDQRNCGKTYLKNDPSSVTPTTTLDQAIQDTYEVVQYLRAKYNQDKIIIMGASWGSALGTLFSLQYPQLVYGYIGVGQLVNLIDNERQVYEKVMECAKLSGNKEDVEQLLAIGPYPLRKYDTQMSTKMTKLRKLKEKYQLGEAISKELVWSVMTSPFYTISDTRYFLIPNVLDKRHSAIMDELFRSYDLFAKGKKLEVPVFYIQGEDDWETPYTLAHDYFAMVEAPVKRFYSIPNAGHMPMLDQKERFNQALYEIISLITHDR